MKLITIGTVTVLLLVVAAGVRCQQDDKEMGKGSKKMLTKPMPDSTTAKPCSCTRTYAPVCANNGVTYNNQCAFLCAKKLNRSLKVTRVDRCKKPVEAEA
uniref:Kazal-like domain-containing protein n=1 Tax=Anopheles funestus TaxID=62324 RepID=A0A4Y0BTR0_ANOFN